ncbi:copper chaperone PCu(A)C [Paracoccus suum]|uniref:Copper chaperone PCu(A)C n=1 Tax=Paracoccus suum TaxID=2259340 RepID=A0A344PG91_9RHOB|nr:copper chaperone PCu(A)C [Paracoccus suum]AXC48396.1 copper chaperone PCu(A)C [Paracoccus suum]
MKTTALTLAAACLPLIAAAAEPAPTVADAYARSANAHAGAAFMTIHNPGAADCTLQGAQSTVAERTELHGHKEEGGVMKMVKVESLTVPAGGDLKLERGGNHVMLMGLEKPLKAGETVALTLDFGPCGQVPADVPVDNERASGAPMSHAGHDMAPAAGHHHGAPATADAKPAN